MSSTGRRQRRVRAPWALISSLGATSCLTPAQQFVDPKEEITSGDGGSAEPGTGGDSPLSGGTGGVADGGTGGDGSGGDGSGAGGSGGDGSGGDGSGGDGSGGDGSGGTVSTACYGTPPALFFDDFEMGANCWLQNTVGDWSLVPIDGYSATQGFKQGSSQAFRLLAIAGESTWTDVRVEAYIKVLDWGSGVLQDQVALIARYEDESNFYYVSMSALGSEEKVRLKKSVSGVSSQIGSSYIVSGGWALDTWYQIAIEVTGTSLRAFVNGVPRLDSHTDATFVAGQVGIGTMQDATIVVDNVTVTQL